MSILGAILFVILFFIFFIFILGINLIASFVGGLRELWNILTGRSSTDYNRDLYSSSRGNARGSNSSQNGDMSGQSSYSGSGKVFADDEGTYVDFEEVKE